MIYIRLIHLHAGLNSFDNARNFRFCSRASTALILFFTNKYFNWNMNNTWFPRCYMVFMLQTDAGLNCRNLIIAIFLIFFWKLIKTVSIGVNIAIFLYVIAIQTCLTLASAILIEKTYCLLSEKEFCHVLDLAKIHVCLFLSQQYAHTRQGIHFYLILNVPSKLYWVKLLLRRWYIYHVQRCRKSILEIKVF